MLVRKLDQIIDSAWEFKPTLQCQHCDTLLSLPVVMWHWADLQLWLCPSCAESLSTGLMRDFIEWKRGRTVAVEWHKARKQERAEAKAVENSATEKLPFNLRTSEDRVPSARAWWVYSVCLREGWLMLQCTHTGVFGVVKDATLEELKAHSSTPTNPVRWADAARVELMNSISQP